MKAGPTSSSVRPARPFWNVVRTSVQIAANYLTEFSAPPAGLMSNCRFDEGGGNTAFDNAGVAENMGLNGGATFSTDVHP